MDGAARGGVKSSNLGSTPWAFVIRVLSVLLVRLLPYLLALEKLLGFSLEKCLMKVWPNTDLFCGGSHGIPADERLRVKRPYGRVDRVVSERQFVCRRFSGVFWSWPFVCSHVMMSMSALFSLSPSRRKPPNPPTSTPNIPPSTKTLQALKQELRSRALNGGAVLLPMAVDPSSVVHGEEGSLLRLSDGTQINTRLLLDCSGYQSTLVKLDGVHNPGVQVSTTGWEGEGMKGKDLETEGRSRFCFPWLE